MTKAPTILRTIATSLALLCSTAAVAAPASQKVVFVSCPMLRNTSLPCWLGEDASQLYYLGPQTDLTSTFYPPQFRHKMLVEGELAGGPTICGGIALKNVTASVLPQLDESCNVMLPAEGYPDPPNNRGTGPSGVRGGPPPPPRNIYAQPVYATPTPPFTVKEFVATFNADTDRKWAPATKPLTAAYHYAVGVNADRVEITGYRAAIRLSNGQDFVEDPQVAEDRANTAAQAFAILGLPKTTKVVVKWESQPTPSAGLGMDAPHRRVVVKVFPGAAPTPTKVSSGTSPAAGG